MFLLAKTWTESIDPAGWLVSEKLNGWRALWDGKRLLTREGISYPVPKWFVEDLPSFPLDGEIWAGRNNRIAVSTLGSRPAAWKKVIFATFDVPAIKEPFENRLEVLKTLKGKFMTPLKFVKCKGHEHLNKLLDNVLAQGGEGLMLRKPGSLYVQKRSNTLLKVKPWFYETAKIVGYSEGTRPGLVGAIVVMSYGKTFKIGTGLTEAIRRNPPAVGRFIEYRFHEFDPQTHIPETPSFVRLT